MAPDVLGLHDRRIRGPDGRLSPANLDHLVTRQVFEWSTRRPAPRGLRWAVGCVHHHRTERLVSRGRDRSRLLAGLATQVAAVAAELERVGADVPVRGAFCFV